MKSNARYKLGRRLQYFRGKCGYTQEKLAEITGVDYKYVQKIEGKKPPAVRIDTIEKFAKAFKIKCSKLMDF